MQAASYFLHLKFLPLKGGDFVDKELAGTLIDVVIGCAFIMAFIVAACLVTPKIARLMEKKFPQLKESPERVEENAKGQFPEDNSPMQENVKSIFESSEIEGFDPNYKIYNKDIYGVDFKHGKKQKNG